VRPLVSDLPFGDARGGVPEVLVSDSPAPLLHVGAAAHRKD
jgi:hypothetical protein